MSIKEQFVEGRIEVFVDLLAQDEMTSRYLALQGFRESHCMIKTRELVFVGSWMTCIKPGSDLDAMLKPE